MIKYKNIPDSLINKIKKVVKDKKILFFCVGNSIRGDDGVGEYIHDHLEVSEKHKKLYTGNAPINYFGMVEKIKPDLVIIVDCINSKDPPGNVRFQKLSKLYSASIDTHSGLMDEFIRLMYPTVKWYILGIQPLSLTEMDTLSDVVKNSADELISRLNKL